MVELEEWRSFLQWVGGGGAGVEWEALSDGIEVGEAGVGCVVERSDVLEGAKIETIGL